MSRTPVLVLLALLGAGPVAAEDRAETLLYAKDFRDGKADGWMIGELSYSASARVVEGQYRIAGRCVAYYEPGTEWSDFRVEFVTSVRRWAGE